MVQASNTETRQFALGYQKSYHMHMFRVKSKSQIEFKACLSVIRWSHFNAVCLLKLHSDDLQGNYQQIAFDTVVQRQV